jgi:hypothetical protein
LDKLGGIQISRYLPKRAGRLFYIRVGTVTVAEHCQIAIQQRLSVAVRDYLAQSHPNSVQPFLRQQNYHLCVPHLTNNTKTISLFNEASILELRLPLLLQESPEALLNGGAIRALITFFLYQ